MRILPFVPVLMLAAMLLAGCNQPENSAPSVAVVDTARVFRDSDPGKAGVKFLESLHEKMQGELNALQEAVQKNPEDQAAQQKLQETYMNFQQRMGAEQQNVITLLNDATQRTLDNYREQKKLEIILSSEAALSFGKTVDVTGEIIAELNKQKIAFKPMAPEAAKEPAVTVPAADAKASPSQNATTPSQNATKPAPAHNATKPAPAHNATKTGK